MGGLWQALAFGFAGLRPRGRSLRIDPRLPPTWPALRMRVLFRGRPLGHRDRHDDIAVEAERRRAAPHGRRLGGDDMKKVIAAVDDSLATAPVLATARAVAGMLGASVEAVHVSAGRATVVRAQCDSGRAAAGRHRRDRRAPRRSRA